MKDDAPKWTFYKTTTKQDAYVFIVWEIVLDSLQLFPEESVEKNL